MKAVPEMCQHLNSGKKCDTHLLYLKKRKCLLMNVLTSISTPTSTQLVEFICLNSKLRTLNPADLEVSIASCLNSRHLCIGNLLFSQIWPWQRSRGSLGWLRRLRLYIRILILDDLKVDQPSTCTTTNRTFFPVSPRVLLGIPSDFMWKYVLRTEKWYRMPVLSRR